MDHSNKAIVVTGGSRGLGLAVIRDLIDMGYNVMTCSRSQSRELKYLTVKVGESRLKWSPCNIGEEKEEERYFAGVEQWLGDREFYGLVNNAGAALDGILATFPNVETERIIATNLLGAIRMARLALRNLLTHDTGGRIINISSIIGSRGYTGLTAYSASKAGLDGFTRALAREIGRRNITVNSVAPGYLETEMSSGLATHQRQQIVNRTPLRRLGKVEDIVPAVRFLLGEEGSFITGQTIIVDGGITC